MSRRTDEASAQAPVAPVAPVSQPERFDPFGAGDSEVPQVAQEPGFRRAAVPGGRYTGARTAVPSVDSALANPGAADDFNQFDLFDHKVQPNASSDSDGQDDPQLVPGMADRRSMQQRQPAPFDLPAQARGVNQPAAPTRRPVQQEMPVKRTTPQRPAPANRPEPSHAAGVNRPIQARDMDERPVQGVNRSVAPQQRPQGNRPAPQQMPQGNRPAPQQMPGGNRPVPKQAAQGNRPMQQGAPERRPMGQQPAMRPAQQGTPQRVPGEEAYARKQAPAQNANQYAYRPQQGRAPYDEEGRNPHASVNRRPYDFENEEAEEPRRRGGALLPIVITLLVLGGLLAGLCLPDWQGVGGGIGSALGPVKATVVSAFASVKNMIIPEEEPIKSFAVSTSDMAAPASLRLTVQTSKNIAGIRVEDDQGKVVYSRSFDSQLTLSGEAIENSNALIWTPTCTIEDAYEGGFTVYAQKADGTESEGLRADTTVAIAAPKAVLPPVQSFTSDTDESPVPASVVFTLVTSADVEAVRVVDQYNSPVTAMSINDTDGENGAMIESGDIRTWTLNADIDAPYTGKYAAQYQTADDTMNYVDSGYTLSAAFTMEEGTEAGDDKQATAAAPVALTGGDATVAAATAEPTLAPTPSPVPTPSPTPTAEPTLAPDSTPLPSLSAEASEGAMPSSDTFKTKATIYSNEKVTESYNRTNAVSILNPFTTYAGGSDYAIWKQAGVLTFRSGPMRQNAAYGTADVQSKTLTQIWSQPVGSMKVSNDTLYGVNAPGQPVIVKWPNSLRQRMALNETAREITALKEVMVAGQDGKIYFFNLLDGTATRDVYDIGAPSAGGLSVATNGTPIIGVGQSHSKLSGKTVKSGYHIISLLKNQEVQLVQTDSKIRNSNYSGVLGAALFDSKTGTMIFGSQGGVLYTVELGKQGDTYDYQAGTISLGSDTQAYKATVKGQDKKNTNIDSSIAMYGSYAYYGDQAGIVQCVNVNTMTPVWTVNMGDNIDATPALDMDDENTVALYLGNTIVNNRKEGTCTIQRINALTGAVDWSYTVTDVVYQADYDVGLEASPLVGQKNIGDLVMFTVTNGANGSRMIAFNKKTGSVAWQTDFTAETSSSPVAVYNEAGDAWIIQALHDGQINLLDGKTGEVLDTLKLDTEIKASPAVYGNLLVIGSTGKDKSNVYCIEID